MVKVVDQLLAGSCFLHQVSPKWWMAVVGVCSNRQLGVSVWSIQ